MTNYCIGRHRTASNSLNLSADPNHLMQFSVVDAVMVTDVVISPTTLIQLFKVYFKQHHVGLLSYHCYVYMFLLYRLCFDS